MDIGTDSDAFVVGGNELFNYSVYFVQNIGFCRFVYGIALPGGHHLPGKGDV